VAYRQAKGEKAKGFFPFAQLTIKKLLTHSALSPVTLQSSFDPHTFSPISRTHVYNGLFSGGLVALAIRTLAGILCWRLCRILNLFYVNRSTKQF
jgi:hypothetical protein